MASRVNESAVSFIGKEVFMSHLESFPHGKLVKTTQGQHGHIDWYEIPDGAEVLAYDESTGSVVPAQATYWTVHHGCPVEIVTLSSGRQIFTDDDPRALYGTRTGSLELVRSTPTEALESGFIVPRASKLSDAALPVSITELDTDELLGDEKSVASKSHKLNATIQLDESFGYFVGVVVGDGWATIRRDVCIAGITDEVIDACDEIIADLFDGVGPKRCTVISEASYGESRRHTYTASNLARLIKPLVGSGADNKHLPPWFLSAPVEFKEGLFAGLMDTDGSISISNAKKKPQLMSNYATNSLRLAQEVRLLAGSLGIAGRITPSKTPAGKPCWILSFANYDIKKWGAKYMRHPEKLAKLASIEVHPSPAQARMNIVPATADICAAAMTAIRAARTSLEGDAKKKLDSLYVIMSKAKKNGFTTREAAVRCLELLGTDCELPGLAEWQTIVNATDVTWEVVESVDKTGEPVTGFDLSVPGYETFMNVDGVILSNTMQLHVPISREAVAEAKEKMLPSKNLLAAGDFKAHYVPSQEFQHGLWSASAKSSKKEAQTFASVDAAVAAYQNGELDADDKVRIIPLMKKKES